MLALRALGHEAGLCLHRDSSLVFRFEYKVRYVRGNSC